MADTELLLAGGFELSGAYGPMILIEMPTQQSVRWLQDRFLSMTVESKTVDLAVTSGVLLDGVDHLELVIDGLAVRPRVYQRGARAFVWRCSTEGWATMAGLLEPFRNGQSGHQYVWDVLSGDVIVELSYGEIHSGVAPREEQSDVPGR